MGGAAPDMESSQWIPRLHLTRRRTPSVGATRQERHNLTMRAPVAAVAVLLASCVAAPPSGSPSADVATPNASAVRAALDARFGTLTPFDTKRDGLIHALVSF